MVLKRTRVLVVVKNCFSFLRNADYEPLSRTSLELHLSPTAENNGCWYNSHGCRQGFRGHVHNQRDDSVRSRYVRLLLWMDVGWSVVARLNT